jgi:tripartite-type tricarboxylate transporter receptor subunit TctC
MRLPPPFRRLAIGRLAATFAFAVLACTAAGTASAQNYVRLVVAFPPGGPSDLMARIISEQLSKELKENVVVENRPGGNGAIAAEQVLRQPADGKTLWFTTSGAITINPGLYPKLAYNVKDFAPVSLVVHTPEVLVVNPKNPANTLQEFLDNAKKKQVNFASSGIGSMPHMAIGLITQETGIQFLHVPEKGAAPAISDLMGTHVDAFVGDVPGVASLVKSGGLKAIAMASNQRSNVFPEVKTFAEQGVKGVEVDNWSAIYVNGKTPPEIVDKLNKAVRAAIADPAVAAKLRDLGVDPAATSPQEMAQLADTDRAKWTKIIKDYDIKPE